MKNLANETFKYFNLKFNNPTLSKISRMTNINRTRVFRIMNGASIRLDEWMIFSDLVHKESTEILLIMMELNYENLLEIKTLINRKYYLQMLKEN